MKEIGVLKVSKEQYPSFLFVINRYLFITINRDYPPMRVILLSALTILSVSAAAQITITAATFPKAGDTLRYALDLAPTVNAATPPGFNQTWDFGSLKAAQTEVIAFLPASAGVHKDKFPGADMLTLTANGGENYYNETTATWENMGFVGASANTLNVVSTVRYSPVLVERRAPVAFFDIRQQESNTNLAFSAAALPEMLLANLHNMDVKKY